MNQRLKLLRKSLKMSQEIFGAKLGITGAGISKIESGDRNLTDHMLMLICHEFHVSERWLRSGQGEMFQPLLETDELSSYLAKMLVNDSDAFSALMRSFILVYGRLDEASRRTLNQVIDLTAEEWLRNRP